ncbi:MAG: PadR family transcriptional regulator [Actinobacteria bacterium]|nr:PadR family transcriptional regulator [Actinomycetota bacterium]MBO0785632.1 PadR family transcriptional regulator [Actinomycetota bacterium]MBO0814459.1 PadR family transcriptional regulator [Actinomycetota bacterium]
MNLTRLMVLGTLARFGPRHGHEIRRLAEVTNVGEWGGVSVGALYRELRVMEGEGLVEPVRTEKVGRRPARTVYAITSEGQLELTVLREQAVRGIWWGPNPLGVALTFTGIGDAAELGDWLRGRRDTLAVTAGQLAAERERLVAKGYLDPAAAAVMHRAQLHVETEVRWHDEFSQVLACLPPGQDASAPAPESPHSPHSARATDSPGSPAGPHRAAPDSPHSPRATDEQAARSWRYRDTT